ncbi:uncharacterized protein LOC103570584 isoform X3 [Microplitis demolitor]|uniref:uncharacterized protein LOC103570584 isoform X3 n=1 Tax=Microplitis demolitor TaxID=69319 RepID=UPI00235B6F1E|nr:uncharacterized protein LOC103570584 isoform X3 [Microplitis demolitor]
MTNCNYSQSQLFIVDLVCNYVRISLNCFSTSVAVRINDNDKRIQIIDNSKGINYQDLENFGINYKKIHNIDANINEIVFKMHQIPLIIFMTKSENSQYSYAKIFKFGRALKVKKILDRPINGTTTTIYFGKNVYERGFLNRQNFKEILENFALDYPQVSFTMRDDVRQKIIMGIKKKSSDQLQKYKIVKKSKNSTANLFNFKLNNTYPKNNINAIIDALFHKKITESTEIDMDKQTIPSSEDDQLKFDNQINYNKKMTIPMEVSCDLNNISGEWSDWILNSPNDYSYSINNDEKYLKNYCNSEKQCYSFLPQKLNKILRAGGQRLFNHQLSNGYDNEHNFSFHSCHRKNFDNVRICKNKRIFSEITIDKHSLQQIKVLRQVNFEYIAGVVEQNNERLLILIDQHAMDERIRYENLLEGAIKFGDPLNMNQCNDLLNYWIKTDLPNRCAHGRPAIIPLLTFKYKYFNNNI